MGRKTGLVCLENFAGAAGLLCHVDQIFSLPGGEFLRDVETDWKKALVRFQEFTQDVKQRFSPERVINLTPSVAARVLARRLFRGETAGFSIDAEGFRRDASPWAAFLEISAANRGLSPFNIVDLFRRAAGLGRMPAVSDLAPVASERLAGGPIQVGCGAPSGTLGFVGFQLGASEDARLWPVEYIARLGEAGVGKVCPASGASGSGGEKKLATRYLTQCRAPAVDLVGTPARPIWRPWCRFCASWSPTTPGPCIWPPARERRSWPFFWPRRQPFDTWPYRPGSVISNRT